VASRFGCALVVAIGIVCPSQVANAQAVRPVFESSARDSSSSIVALGTRLRIRSNVLHETREVIVATPPSYNLARGKFPVLYVLDGAENVLTTVSASRALAEAGRMPPVIVVAIVNTQRDRDFTPKLVRTNELPPGVETVGGADAFLRFVGTELIPAVDAKYRTQPMRTVIGHSLGGLLAMRALATAPNLFKGYLTLEPSLWWDARQPVSVVLDSLRAHPEEVGRLAAVEGTSDEGWKPDWAALGKAAPAHFRISFVHVENESHENLPYRGIYEGLAALFSDYMPAMRHDLSFSSLAALNRQYGDISRDFGYKVNPPLGAILTIANREANQRRFDSARQALAKADSLYPGASDTKNFRAGVEDAAAEASRDGLKPVESTVRFKPTTRVEAEPFLGEWNALVRVVPGTPMNGSATFFLRGDTLFLSFTARGVAIDGGDLVEPPAPVRIDGTSIIWDRENAGGGRAVTTAHLANGKIEGEELLVGGRAMPAGFDAPRVTIEMTRR
jgi:enterochelin esterase-like enzyme